MSLVLYIACNKTSKSKNGIFAISFQKPLAVMDSLTLLPTFSSDFKLIISFSWDNKACFLEIKSRYYLFQINLIYLFIIDLSTFR